jgi:hypothetical protein
VSGNGQAARPEGDRPFEDTHSTLPADAELMLPERVTIGVGSLDFSGEENALY